MNANELADLLDKHTGGAGNIYQQAATMLRPQQTRITELELGDIQWSHAFDLAKIEIADLKAEIEALKKEAALQRLSDFTQEAAKTLTDEEIWRELTTVKHTWIATTSVWFEFEKEELTKAIRAILKKAQE